MTVHFNAASWVAAIGHQIDQITNEGKQVVEAAASTGARMTEDLTRTRPSKKSGKRGRVDTGLMADSVSSQVVEDTPNKIVAEFGWLGDVEPYFVYQTATGFIHNRSGEYIEPTFALRDATEHVRELINQWIRTGGGTR